MRDVLVLAEFAHERELRNSEFEEPVESLE